MRFMRAIWRGPFYVGPLAHPVSLGSAVLKVFEVLWRAIVLLASGTVLTLCVLAASYVYDSEVHPRRERALEADLFHMVMQEVKPHWKPPCGNGVERLVTTVGFSVDRRGQVGDLKVIRQSGIDPSNRAYIDKHADKAVQAVLNASPLDLPVKHFEKWKKITVSFDQQARSAC